MKRIAGLLAVGVFALAATIGYCDTTPGFFLGFKALADQVPDVVGQPTEDEHYGANGGSLQATTTGLMVWRKADNWTAFTNGSRTWVNGPNGVQERGNDERFEWESPPQTAAPILTTQFPSDWDLYRTYSMTPRPDGTVGFSCSIGNSNHYWRAVDLAVTAVLIDSGGQVVLERPATGGPAELGPQSRGTWRAVIPAGTSWESASAKISFRWVPPGS